MPRPSKTTIQPPPSPVEALVQRMDARARGESPGDGVPTGFPSLDRMLGGGFRRQDLIVLGGDVGSGKSSLALAIALRSVKAGYPVAYLSGEMSEERLMERALAQEARVSVDALRGGELDDLSRAAVGAAAVRLRGLPLVIQPLAGERFAEVSEALGTVPRPSLLVLDDVQMTASPVNAPSAEERTAATVRALKNVALEHDVALLAVAQLPAFRSTRRDPRPTLDDLGGLGAVKQVADVVLTIYREEMYRPSYGVEGAVELIIGKNRNGPSGYVDLYFYRNWLRFEDMLDPDR
ncbi:MAG TPA: DnaB-like helicase C-terminal domain-containing protein [Gemmatimonadales bacterium]|jgi:replicative DNA helicase|nr:DnaB-like helicase C-terminal domain-containing protein [Gemmatimonadales bacterium]